MEIPVGIRLRVERSRGLDSLIADETHPLAAMCDCLILETT